MYHMKYYKSVGGILMIKNGLSALLLKSPQKGFQKISDVSVCGRRFFNTGGIATESSLVKRDTFSAGDILILFSGRQSLGCLASHQCNKSKMFPYTARSLTSTSASQSSGQSPQQEPKLENKWQFLSSSELSSSELSSSELSGSEVVIEGCDGTYSKRGSLHRFPGLMVHGMAENSKTRRLFRLNPVIGYFEKEEYIISAAASHDHSHPDKLAVPHGHVCRGSAYGYLFLTDDNLDMKLFNPLTGSEIKLPPVKSLPPSEHEEDQWLPSKWSVHKAVFSINPLVERRPVVLVIYGGQHIPRLAFCKPGDERWTPLELPIKRHFQWGYVRHKDVVYHDGLFYVLSHPGYVTAVDIGRRYNNDDDLCVKTTLVAIAAKRERIHARDWYLVVLDGEMVRFEFKKACFCDCCIEKTNRMMEKERLRDGDTTDEDEEDENKDYDGRVSPCVEMNLPHLTYGIKIRRFNVSEQQWVKLESLGDKAVFLGYNTSFALSALKCLPAGHCIPNSIYFTYGEGGNEDTTEKSCYDMGIYDVKDKSIKRPLYLQDDYDDSKFKKPAPVWFVKSFNIGLNENGVWEYSMYF